MAQNWKFEYVYDGEWVLDYDDGLIQITVTNWDDEMFALQEAMKQLTPKAKRLAAVWAYEKKVLPPMYWLSESMFVTCGKVYDIDVMGIIRDENGTGIDINEIKFENNLNKQCVFNRINNKEWLDKRWNKMEREWEATWIDGPQW